MNPNVNGKPTAVNLQSWSDVVSRRAVPWLVWCAASGREDQARRKGKGFVARRRASGEENQGSAVFPRECGNGLLHSRDLWRKSPGQRIWVVEDGDAGGTDADVAMTLPRGVAPVVRGAPWE